MRSRIMWIVAIVCLVIMNAMIFQKEFFIAKGVVVYLKLAPKDPRSLMQGDYMVLNYDLPSQISHEIYSLIESKNKGIIVIELDDSRIARFSRIHDASVPLQKNEVLLKYTFGAKGIQFVSESFFFQEGNAEYFSKAKYAEIKVLKSGDSVLVGLCDENFVKMDLKEIKK